MGQASRRPHIGACTNNEHNVACAGGFFRRCEDVLWEVLAKPHNVGTHSTGACWAHELIVTANSFTVAAAILMNVTMHLEHAHTASTLMQSVYVLGNECEVLAPKLLKRCQCYMTFIGFYAVDDSATVVVPIAYTVWVG
jgi:hypothetical protein